MADAWSTAPGQKPIRPDVAGIIRAAQNSVEHAGDAGLGGDEVALEGTSLRHTSIGDSVGGGSSLGGGALGSAALTAALTLHPCVHVSGIGDASREVIHEMMATVGACSVTVLTDEETGDPTGEASATFASAAQAEAAIRAFDGSRFNDGTLRVTVAKKAARGSFTDRGRPGRGRGGGRRGGNGLTFAEKQKDHINELRVQRQQDEKDAFAKARAAAAASSSSGASSAAERPAASRPSAFDAPAEAKRRKVGGLLPGMVVVRATSGGSGGNVGGSGGGEAPGAAAAAPGQCAHATPVASQGAAATAAGNDGNESGSSGGHGGGLLGLGAYGSSDDEADA